MTAPPAGTARAPGGDRIAAATGATPPHGARYDRAQARSPTSGSPSPTAPVNASSTTLRRELAWLLLGASGAFLTGLVTGLPALLPALYLAGHAAWLLWRMGAIVRWLEGGAHAANAPPTVGLGNRMVELVHREKKYSRKQKHRYRNALAQFNGLAAELPDAIVVLDAQHQIRWANTAAQALLAVHPERDRGQRIDNLVRSPGFRELIADGQETGDGLEMELPSGSGRTLVVRKVSAGNKMSVLIARDETQRVRLREMRKAFVADVSHELRTPLTVIEGYLEMLRESEQLDPGTRSAIGHVSAQSARMHHIVEHLLQLSRLEGNPLGEEEGEPIAVGPLLRSMVVAAVDTTSGVARERFAFDIDDTLALRGSESEIWSACNNLVTNAVKYGGGCRIEIGWGLDADGRPVCTVRDDGPGIEARHVPRLSERFYRVDKNRSRDSGGTGLGLAIVKHAAQRHGGQLHIESTPGVGSTFRIEFPPARAVALDARAAANMTFR